MKRTIAIISAAVLLTLTGCSGETQASSAQTDTAPPETVVIETTAENIRTEIPEFEVTSSTVDENGTLPFKCTAEAYGGENASPQISWTPVEAASVYAVYMYDVSLRNWTHICAKGLTETSFEEGAFDSTQYIGPYPPDNSGKHEYVITVYALRTAPEKYGGVLDAPTANPAVIEEILNKADGGNNIVAVGRMSVFFTANEAE